MANIQSVYTTPDIRQIVDSTSFSWTAGLSVGATGGTLSGAFGFTSGTYILNFPDSIQGVNAEQRIATLTNGSTAVTWTQPLLNSVGTSFTVQSISVASQNMVVSNAPVLLTSSNTSNGVVLNAAKQRIGWSIQNQGTNVVYVCLGAGASSTQLHYTLKAGTGAADGTGGSISFFSGSVYDGAVSVAGTSFSVSVVDLRMA
jgi:hypothetical protein